MADQILLEDAIKDAEVLSGMIKPEAGEILMEWINVIQWLSDLPEHDQAKAKLINTITGYARLGIPYDCFNQPPSPGDFTIDDLTSRASKIDSKKMAKKWIDLQKQYKKRLDKEYSDRLKAANAIVEQTKKTITNLEKRKIFEDWAYQISHKINNPEKAEYLVVLSNYYKANVPFGELSEKITDVTKLKRTDIQKKFIAARRSAPSYQSVLNMQPAPAVIAPEPATPQRRAPSREPGTPRTPRTRSRTAPAAAQAPPAAAGPSQPGNQAERMNIKKRYDKLNKDISNAMSKINSNKKAIFAQWKTEIDNKIKNQQERLEILETVVKYYGVNEPFGDFTKPIPDPKKINLTAIREAFQLAKESARPLDEIEQQEVSRPPSASEAQRDASAGSERETSRLQRPQSTPRARTPARTSSRASLAEYSHLADKVSENEKFLKDNMKFLIGAQLEIFKRWAGQIDNKIKGKDKGLNREIKREILTRIMKKINYEPFDKVPSNFSEFNRTAIIEAYENLINNFPLEVERQPTPARVRPQQGTPRGARATSREPAAAPVPHDEQPLDVYDPEPSYNKQLAFMMGVKKYLKMIRSKKDIEAERVYNSWCNYFDEKFSRITAMNVKILYTYFLGENRFIFPFFKEKCPDTLTPEQEALVESLQEHDIKEFAVTRVREAEYDPENFELERLKPVKIDMTNMPLTLEKLKKAYPLKKQVQTPKYSPITLDLTSPERETQNQREQLNVSRRANERGTNSAIRTENSQVGTSPDGDYTITRRWRVAEYDRSLLGLEMKNNPTKYDVLNKINFKIHPEMKKLHYYYRKANKMQRKTLINIINDVRKL